MATRSRAVFAHYMDRRWIAHRGIGGFFLVNGISIRGPCALLEPRYVISRRQRQPRGCRGDVLAEGLGRVLSTVRPPKGALVRLSDTTSTSCRTAQQSRGPVRPPVWWTTDGTAIQPCWPPIWPFWHFAIANALDAFRSRTHSPALKTICCLKLLMVRHGHLWAEAEQPHIWPLERCEHHHRDDALELTPCFRALGAGGGHSAGA